MRIKMLIAALLVAFAGGLVASPATAESRLTGVTVTGPAVLAATPTSDQYRGYRRNRAYGRGYYRQRYYARRAYRNRFYRSRYYYRPRIIYRRYYNYRPRYYRYRAYRRR